MEGGVVAAQPSGLQVASSPAANGMVKKRVLLCGGGNAAHVLTSLLGARDDIILNILTLREGEVDLMKEGLAIHGAIHCSNDRGSDYVGHPALITDRAEEAVPGSDVIILALPAFMHETFLRLIAPYLTPGQRPIIGAMPGQGSFDLCVRDCIGDALFRECTIFETETLPWACRIVRMGCEARVLCTKLEIDTCVAPVAREKEVIDLLQDFIGPLPHLSPWGHNFLGITVNNVNAIAHPCITYGVLREWDGLTPFEEAPLFYGGLDDWTAHRLSMLSHEVQAIKAALEEQCPGLELAAVRHIRHWLLRSYGSEIADQSSLKAMFNSNKAYNGLRLAMVPSPTGKGLYPDFTARYLTEDVPCGLVVTRGIAELARVKTTYIDEMLDWCEKKLGKQYLVKGRMAGRDVGETRAPQRYGFHDLESFMKENGYYDFSRREVVAPERKRLSFAKEWWPEAEEDGEYSHGHGI